MTVSGVGSPGLNMSGVVWVERDLKIILFQPPAMSRSQLIESKQGGGGCICIGHIPLTLQPELQEWLPSLKIIKM